VPRKTLESSTPKRSIAAVAVAASTGRSVPTKTFEVSVGDVDSRTGAGDREWRGLAQ